MGAVQHLIDDFVAVLPRVFQRDHTVFGPEPTEIADRLNWLIAPAVTDVAALGTFATDVHALGVDDVVLCGMGGSSLYARTLAPYATVRSPKLTVVDTTDPHALRRIDAAINYDRAFVMIASKSGSTVETAAQQAFFAGRLAEHHGTDATGRLAAITDPASPLAQYATNERWRHVLLADPDVGGRFSAHTLFGLAPAILVGIDVQAHLTAAEQTFAQLGNANDENIAVVLGAHFAAAAKAVDGVVNLRVELADPNDPLALWIEQLIAESLGKHGRGLNVLTHGMPPNTPHTLTLRIRPDRTATAAALTVSHDNTVFTLTVPDGHRAVAACAAVLMLATALAGRGLAVNPFDQPDVAAAKQATALALDARTPLATPTPLETALEVCAACQSLAVLAYVDPDAKEAAHITALAVRLGEHRQMPVTVGFGPRYLHSTGQLHKGALNDACYLVIGPQAAAPLDIPGRDYGFDTLITAQAAGDVATLHDRQRCVHVVNYDDLSAYVAALDSA